MNITSTKEHFLLDFKDGLEEYKGLIIILGCVALVFLFLCWLRARRKVEPARIACDFDPRRPKGLATRPSAIYLDSVTVD